MRFPLALLPLFALAVAPLPAQLPYAAPANVMRVTVTMNTDGSKTTYETDPVAFKTTATTTEPNGGLRGRIVYRLDAAGRFAAGEVFGRDGQLRFKTVYKYNSAGQLEEEKQFTPEEKLIGRIVYRYDAAGKPAGYASFDGNGRPTGGSPAPAKGAAGSPRPGGRR